MLASLGACAMGSIAGCLGDAESHTFWRFETDWGVFSSPTLSAGVVIAGSADARLYGVDADDGELAWSDPFAMGAAIHASPTVVDGTVFVGSEDGRIYAIDVLTDELAWEEPFEADDSIFSSPTVVDGVVFVESEDRHLYAVDARVDGSSDDSRVSAGTLAHHHAWAGEPVQRLDPTTSGLFLS